MRCSRAKHVLIVLAFSLIFNGCQPPKSDLLKKDLSKRGADNYQTMVEMPNNTVPSGFNSKGQDSLKNIDPFGNQPTGQGMMSDPFGMPPWQGDYDHPGNPPMPTDNEFLEPPILGPGPGLPPGIPGPICGNGILEFGEECDGTAKGIVGCNRFCRLPYCGNLVTDLGEECDDGNHEDCDGCDSRCLYERCGNGRLDCIQKDPLQREECDLGVDNGQGKGCSYCCLFEVCGNGVIDPGEQCDDGDNNGKPGYNCNCLCQLINCPAGLMCVPSGETSGPVCE